MSSGVALTANNPETSPDSVRASFRWVVLLVGCLALVCYGMNIVVYAPLAAEIARDLKVDISNVLQLSTVFVLVTAIASAFGGVLVDKWRLSTLYIFSLLCASVPAVVMPWIGHSYFLVLMTRIVQGPIAIAFITVGPILALWFPAKEHGLAGGFMTTSVVVGLSIGLWAAPVLYQRLGTWQMTAALFSAPAWITMALALLIHGKLPPRNSETDSAAPSVATSSELKYRDLMRVPITWAGTLVMACQGWGLYCLLNLVPPYVAAGAPLGLGLGLAMAGTLSLVLAASGIPATLIGGIFFDRVGKGDARPSLLVGFLTTGVAASLLLASIAHSSLPFLAVVLTLAGFGMNFVMPAIGAYLARVYPPSMVGGMMGFWITGGILGGAIGVYVAGVTTANTGTFRWGFVSVSVATSIGFLLSLFLRPTRDERKAL